MFKNKANFSFFLFGLLNSFALYASASILEFKEYIFDPGKKYNEGRICLEQNNLGDIFLTPEKPQRSTQQMATFFEESLDSLDELDSSVAYQREEAVLMTVIPNRDGRTPVGNTTEWPYCIHTKLSMKFPNYDGLFGGTGILIGPHHILTCGHNIFDHQRGLGRAEAIQAHPALNGHLEPFGRFKVTRAYVFKEWVEQANPDFDMALMF